MFAEVVSQQNPVILNLRQHPDSEQVTVDQRQHQNSSPRRTPNSCTSQETPRHRTRSGSRHRTVEICPRGREGTLHIMSRTPHTQCPRRTPSCPRATLAATMPCSTRQCKRTASSLELESAQGWALRIGAVRGQETSHTLSSTTHSQCPRGTPPSPRRPATHLNPSTRASWRTSSKNRLHPEMERTRVFFTMKAFQPTNDQCGTLSRPRKNATPQQGRNRTASTSCHLFQAEIRRVECRTTETSWHHSNRKRKEPACS